MNFLSLGLRSKLAGYWYKSYLSAVISSSPNVLSPVHPVHQALQGVEADGTEILHNVNGQNHVWTLFSQDHSTDGALLAEEQEARGRC